MYCAQGLQRPLVDANPCDRVLTLRPKQLAWRRDDGSTEWYFMPKDPMTQQKIQDTLRATFINDTPSSGKRNRGSDPSKTPSPISTSQPSEPAKKPRPKRMIVHEKPSKTKR